MVPATILMPIGMLIAGWGAEKHVHWIVPDIVSDPRLETEKNTLHDNHIRAGHCNGRSGYDIEFRVDPDIYSRCIHDIRRIWWVHLLPVISANSCTPFSFVALAASNCLRSLAGFGFPLFAPAMYRALGFGKGNTVLAVVAIVIGCPAYV